MLSRTEVKRKSGGLIGNVWAATEKRLRNPSFEITNLVKKSDWLFYDMKWKLVKSRLFFIKLTKILNKNHPYKFFLAQKKQYQLDENETFTNKSNILT